MAALTHPIEFAIQVSRSSPRSRQQETQACYWKQFLS